ncbi:hypothetical protein MNBD_BACTEROID03-1169 [hydrothermal vent metagenome]|uniref:Uncharacterized protein n=1 Tax=hydrothermal vent metagenome TaxID=652676 RepID=A0A3B0TJ18_9ZZZZ
MMGRNPLQPLKKKQVKNKINFFSNHIIVCGYGRNGMQAAERLRAYKKLSSL